MAAADGFDELKARLFGPDQCPRCVWLRANTKRFVAWCPVCLRWQGVSGARFIIVPHAVYRHLGCVECGLTVWCRDLLLHPMARACVYHSHAHEPGECPGASPRVTGVDRTTWRVWRTRAPRDACTPTEFGGAAGASQQQPPAKSSCAAVDVVGRALSERKQEAEEEPEPRPRGGGDE